MALCKIVLTAALIAGCRALVDPEDAVYNTHPRYDYSYGVHDPLTGDSKTATETRDGDVVHGSYSLVEPDGSVRTVKYTASDATGFNAVVEKSGAGAAPAVVAQDVARSAVIPAPAPVSVYSAPGPVYSAPGPVYSAAPEVRTEPRGFSYSFSTPVNSYARVYQSEAPSYGYYKPAVSYYQEPQFVASAYQPYQGVPYYSSVRYQQPVLSSGYSSPFARSGSNYVSFSSPHVSYSH